MISDFKGAMIFDLDGTLCPIKKEGEQYDDLAPYNDVVEKLKEYKSEGFKIVINTARNMRTYNGSLGLINANTAKSVLAWLDKWEIPYDEILFGKPWPGPKGFYIDDRAVRPSEILNYTIEELEQIVREERKKLR